MILDQSPQIIGEITPALRAQIGCSALWRQWLDVVGMGDDNKRREEIYHGYMHRCLKGDRVMVFMRNK